ncbi:nucleotide sugar dehydrogenase [Sulfuriroseicoccus oceanibius]|uniref:Nucleotide sugar dehydrogenase n=2 Tax=Sulfuriroseicoccus oceanibius TaxID=2707525 RepID=A0A7T7F283_9BACT|nr:nucleotide sugar dehydrogenase [Sulfuriroseicoccus oceanibius]QQL45466.1 nucleotide sugar dehydrogenase [Sulfuriroseicoccus oceanibius]
MQLLEKIQSKDAVIGIVGLGYVGLPLMLAFSAKGYHSVGFDIDQSKVDSIKAGESYIDHIDSAPLGTGVSNGLIDATTDFSRIAEVDAIIMCVPTPLDEHLEPDLSYVTNTMDAVAPYLRSGQVVSLESTTYPGTTEEELKPRIEAQGLTVGTDVFLVYSPEREDPGNPEFSSKNIPKVVGGTTPACAEVGKALYEAAIASVVPVSSTQVAEFTKLLENIYRAVNIGLVNELKIAADKMGIDIWEVINAAATKPFGFKAFYPGPGLGGHCIPIDPFYLTWKAREYGVHTRFIELAGQINRSMPQYVVRATSDALNRRKKAVNGSKILLMGLAYKEDVDDMRESPAFELMDLLKEQGAEVDYYDPHLPVITPTREHAEWTGTQSIEWNEQAIRGYDAVLISTHHKAFDLQQLVDWADIIVDTRNALAKSGIEPKDGQLTKA